MVNMIKLTRCPYCNKYVILSEGISTFYRYGGNIHKTVSIADHGNCGLFVTTDVIFNHPTEYYSMFGRYPFNKIQNLVVKYYTGKEDVNDLTDIVMSNIDDRYIHNREDIKKVIEFYKNQIDEASIFSMPLTDEVKQELTYEGSMSW